MILSCCGTELDEKYKYLTVWYTYLILNLVTTLSSKTGNYKIYVNLNNFIVLRKKGLLHIVNSANKNNYSSSTTTFLYKTQKNVFFLNTNIFSKKKCVFKIVLNHLIIPKRHVMVFL